MGKTIWLTVPLFNAQYMDIEDMRIQAHETEEAAMKQARRDVSSARDMSYRNTGTAIFEVEIGGHGVGADVMLVDKDLTHA